MDSAIIVYAASHRHSNIVRIQQALTRKRSEYQMELLSMAHNKASESLLLR